jgi:hypothetical protein
MRKIAIALVAGAGALFANSAMAADVYTTGVSPVGISESGIQQVRLVCDEFGHCYRTGPRRVIIDQDAYDYVPRERYIEHRHYYDDGPRVGVYGSPRFGAPGISIGVEDDRW